MTNYGRRWPGWEPQSSEIEPIVDCGHRRPPLPTLWFQASEASLNLLPDPKAPIREPILIITRRAFTAALSLTGLAALAGLSPFRLIADALADGVADVAQAQSLPDMALGPKDAAVTITEYSSMT